MELTSLSSGSKSLSSLTSVCPGFNIPTLQTSPLTHSQCFLSFWHPRDEVGLWDSTVTWPEGDPLQTWLLHWGLLGFPVLSPGSPLSMKRAITTAIRGAWIRFFPIKYFDSLATYLSSNPYLCLRLSETDFGRDGRHGSRDGSFSLADN